MITRHQALQHGAVCALTALFLLLGACDAQSPETSEQSAAPEVAIVRPQHSGTGLDAELRARLQERLASHLRDAADGARTLCETISVFTKTPSAANLALARTRWRSAHRLFISAATLQTALGGASLARLDDWPALGGYIDRAPGYPHSGLVFDTTLEITPETLQSQHQLTDSSEVSTGFHALEYLLWGDPDDEPRTFALFLPANGGTALEDQARDRRRAYLRTACELLNKELQTVIGQEQNLPQAMNSSRLLGNAAGLLHQELATRQVMPRATDTYAESECAFAALPLCGVTPAVEELLLLATDTQLATEITARDAELASRLTRTAGSLDKTLHELAGNWPATADEQQAQLHKLAEGLRATAAELRLAANALKSE